MPDEGYELASHGDKKVLAWRRAELVRCGFGEAEAEMLAECKDIEIEQVSEMARAGVAVKLMRHVVR